MKTKRYFWESRLHVLWICTWALWLTTSLSPELAWGQPSPNSSIVLIKAQHVYTITGEVLSPGMVLVRDGKIAAVGKDLDAADAKIVEVHSVLPGLVDAATDIGVSGGVAELTSEVTPELRIASSIDYRSFDFARAVDEGITTTHILPGTNNVFCGGSAIVKTAGQSESKRLINDFAGQVLAVCSDPVNGNSSRGRPDSIYNRQPTNRMGVIWILRSQMQKAKNSTDLKAATPQIQAIAEMFQNQRPIFSVSRTNHDLLSVITLQNEFNFRSTIIGGDESYWVLDDLAKSKMPIIYTALTTGTVVGDERTSLRWNVPGKLETAGIEFALAGGRLLEKARFAVKFGASPDRALAAITQTPAKLLGIADRVGGVAVGMDADLIGLSGDPLSFTSDCQWTMVDGQLVTGDDMTITASTSPK